MSNWFEQKGEYHWNPLAVLFFFVFVLANLAWSQGILPAKVGTKVDGTAVYTDKDYQSINEALAAIGPVRAMLVVSDRQVLRASLAVPSNIFLWVMKSGAIQKASKFTLTIKGGFRAEGQAFFGFDVGDVTFAGGAVDPVLPEWWGAKADGATESGGPLRAALAAVSAAGGKIALQSGTYYLNSYDKTLLSTDEYVVFALPSNVELKGAVSGATSLKLSTSLQKGIPDGRINVIGTRPGTSGQIVRDINFNYDGLTLDIAERDYNAVRSLGGRILLERLYIKNAPGRNMIITTTNATIRNCTIINGSKNVPGNTKATDASFVYMMGADNLVEQCSFTNDKPAVTNCGGVEIHATNSKIVNSIFNNLWPAIYTGVADYTTTAHANEISGNTVSNCSGGVYLIDKHAGLRIVRNYFKNNISNGGYTIMTSRDDNTGVAGAGVQNDVLIADNTFDGMNGIRVAGFQDSFILSNTWNGTWAAIELLGSTTPMKNVYVAFNRFLDPPNAPVLVGQIQMDGSTNAAWSAVYQDIMIQDNLFTSASAAAPTNVYALVPAGHVSYTTMTNVIFRRNDITNLTGKIGGNMAGHAIEPKP